MGAPMANASVRVGLLGRASWPSVIVDATSIEEAGMAGVENRDFDAAR
jgi:hypothetical protein